MGDAVNQGDVIALGKHRLLCGDAFNAEHVDALLQGEKPAMLYCDPPYGIRLKPRYGSETRYTPRIVRGMRSGHTPVVSKDWPNLHGDHEDFDPRPIISRFDGTKEQFWWGADYYRERLPSGGSWLVWDKRVHEQCDKMDGTKFELCWSRQRHQRDIIRVLWSGILGMTGADQGKRVHPTQKPVKLAEWFISRYSKEGDIICDLFGGSGSMLLACGRLNRRALVAEISPDYCQVITERYEHLTQQPSLLDAV